MSLGRERLVRVVSGVAASALLTFAAGCDFFKSSESVQRVAPFLSGLSISPSNVLCGRPFTASFRYDDPQGDISLMRVSLQLTGDALSREEQELWDTRDGLDLTVPGRASWTHTLGCETPGGRWVVTVRVEDLRGHLSNSVSGELTLASIAPR